MHFSALLGWLGAALSIALPWPQVWRSVARGRTSGLSAGACWQGVAMPIGWITYGLLSGETVQVVTNTVTGVAGLAVLVMVLVRRGDLRTGRGLLVGAAGAVAVLSAAGCAAAGPLTGVGDERAATLLGAVLAVSAILGAIPQPLALLRDRGQDLAGLSPLRWWLGAAACGSWSAYGLTTGQAAVWLSALVGLAGALVVCWVLLGDRRARPVTAPAPSPVPDPAAAPAVRTTHAGVRVIRRAPALVTAPAVRVAHPASAVARRVTGPAAGLPRPAPEFVLA